MTREQKISWLATAEAEALLKHYNSTLSKYNKNPFEDGVIEDMELVRAEMIKRLTK